MNLSELNFPVYLLKKSKPSEDLGITFYGKETYTEDEEGGIIITPSLQVVDDITIEGATLAARRLRLKVMGVPLFKLKRAFFFLGDFIKVSSPQQWFIDSSGKIFTHTKSTRAILSCKEITNIFPIPSGGGIIEVGHAQRYKVLHTPDPKLKWAGVLTQGHQQILYGLYEEQFDETWRLI
jgi:hypothetical protein